MKAFRFPLQRVLEWRETRMQLEERKLKALRTRLTGIEARLVELVRSAESEMQLVCRERNVNGSSLAALSAFRVRAKRQITAAQIERAECGRLAGEQEARFLDARRQVRLLEKLKERRKGEWQTGFDKDLEEIAAESFLAKFTSAER